MLRHVAANLWETSTPLAMPGLRMDHRMTVIRGEEGGLLVHSPVEFSEALKAELDTLGQVEWLAAPSLFHDLYWPEWFAEYPGARFFAAPDLREARADLPFQEELGNMDGPWGGTIRTHLIKGMPTLNEVVFLHEESRSLIVGDLIFNLSTDQTFLAKTFLRINGIYGKPNVSRIFRSLIKDRDAFRTSIQEVLRWDFDRILPGHGSIVESGGKAVMEKAFAWLK